VAFSLVFAIVESITTNALKHLMDQEKRILQTDQLKNASKRLQHRVDRTPNYVPHFPYFDHMIIFHLF